MVHARIIDTLPEIIQQTAFTQDGVQYPRDFFTRATQSEKLALGIYEVVDIVDDQSTGPDTTTEPYGALVQDGVVFNRTRVIRDLTAPEIAARLSAQADGIIDQDVGKGLLALMRGLYGVAQALNPSLTPEQFKTTVNAAAQNTTDIGGADFKSWLEGII